MKRFVEGEDRNQVTLLPECLDDYVAEDNPVRVIDVFIAELDLTGLGFEGVAPADTGRPAYHPAVLLKLYVYGYLNRVRRRRRLAMVRLDWFLECGAHCDVRDRLVSAEDFVLRSGRVRPEPALVVVADNFFGRIRAPLPKHTSGTLIASAIVIMQLGDVLCRPIEVSIHR